MPSNTLRELDLNVLDNTSREFAKFQIEGKIFFYKREMAFG
jgi:hypothetical protein